MKNEATSEVLILFDGHPSLLILEHNKEIGALKSVEIEDENLITCE